MNYLLENWFVLDYDTVTCWLNSTKHLCPVHNHLICLAWKLEARYSLWIFLICCWILQQVRVNIKLTYPHQVELHSIDKKGSWTLGMLFACFNFDLKWFFFWCSFSQWSKWKFCCLSSCRRRERDTIKVRATEYCSGELDIMPASVTKFQCDARQVRLFRSH